MTNRLSRAYNYDDIRDLARRRLPRALFEFIDRGVEDEICLRNNREATGKVKLLPQTLAGIGEADTSTEFLGRKLAMPVAISPTGIVGLVHFEGEIAAARAAGRASIPYSLSTASITSVEAVAKGAPETDLWFQLYTWNQLDLTLELVDRARDAGYRVLIVTTDGAGGSNREYNLRNRFTVPMNITPKTVWGVLRRPGWVRSVFLRSVLANGVPTFANYPAEYRSSVLGRAQGLGMAALGNPVVTRDMLCRLRDHWKGPLIVKGILAPDDAKAAVRCGVDGIVVSNHGGRVLDAAPAALDALPAIVQAVGDKVKILIDGGVRRGSDVAKALALGAKVAMMGRMPVWGTAAGGEEGALHAVNIIQAELARVMIQLGCGRIEDLNASFLWNADGKQVG